MWQSGIHSSVRLAAWIAASRAVASTSPLGSEPAEIRASVSGAIRTSPRATQTRRVTGFSETSTMRARPFASR